MTIALTIIAVIVLLGLVGLFIWLALRKKKIKNGFETKHGMHVYLSPQTVYLTKKTVVAWTDDLVDHWHQAMGWSVEKIHETLDGLTVTMLDQEKIQYEGDGNPDTDEFASGLNYLRAKKILITTWAKGQTKVNKHRVWSLWRHEISHSPVAWLGSLWTNKESHALFAETDLGA